MSCIIAGSAYYVRGIDLGVTGKITDKWSMFGGLVLMQSKVTKSNVPTLNMPQPLLFTTNVGLPLANVAHQSFSMLSKYQLTDVWELGGQAVYRSKIYGGTLLAANQGTSIPSYWRFDTFAEAKIDKNWKVKLFVNNIFNKLYYDALYQSATPFVLEAPGRAAYLVISARYLIECRNADLCPARSEQGRCGGVPPHHGRVCVGRRPLHRRRAVGAGKEATSSFRRTARSRAGSAIASFRR